MQHLPEISVVVPCYNQGHLLEGAVRSAFTSARPVEVVVVNDGSTDCTADAMQSFDAWPNTRIRSIHQSNAGAPAARNRGWVESRGRYIVFLDAGDRLTPTGLEAGASALDAHPESAFVFGRSLMTSADGTLVPTTAEPRITTNHYRELLRRNYIGVPGTVMFRREALERAGGFNPAVGATADYELYLHIARHHPIHDHAQIVAHHRAYEAAGRGDVSRMLRETLAVLREQRRFLEGDGASLEAYEDGWRRWQELYGSQLADEMRADMAAGNWTHAASRALVLARYAPRRAAEQAARTLRVGRRLSMVK